MPGDFPPSIGPAFTFTPLSLRPTVTQIVNDVFPLVPFTPMTPAQIAQALIVSGSGLARIDASLDALTCSTLASGPVTIVPAIPGSILVPVFWSLSKTVSAVGALGCTISLTYPAPWAAGVPMTNINADTNNARPGWAFGIGATGLTLFGANNPVGLPLQVIGSADPGNFPATQIKMYISVLFYSYPATPL